ALFGLHPGEVLAARGREPGITGVETVLLEDVAPADLGLLDVRPADLRDVDARLVALDLLHEDVDAEVIGGVERARPGVEEDLDEARPDRVSPDLVAPLIR